MQSDVMVLARSFPEITHDIVRNWYIYLTMPLIAALIGYVTKVLLIEMIYRPLEFKGIGPIGWQGLVPRRAGKVASVTIELLAENLLKPEELLDAVDVESLVDELRKPLEHAVADMAREIVDEISPGGWDALPTAIREQVVKTAWNAAPGLVENILDEMRNDLDSVLDFQHMAITTLVKNKEKLVALMRSTATGPMGFMRRTGVVFGLIIGVIQTALWAIIHEPWIMPAFGLFTGLFTDYLALNLLFRPRRPRKILGLHLQGVLHRDREEITRGYCAVMAEDLFTPEILFDAVLNGPGADRLVAIVQREVITAIDSAGGVLTPVIRLVVGSAEYRALKQRIATKAVALLPEYSQEMHEYTKRTFDLEHTLADKMAGLTPEQYEGMMRPVFKDDEFLVIFLGGFLGFCIGELQVLLVEHLGR